MNLGDKNLIPVLTYLFHRIETALDGTPTILVLDEAWIMLGHPVFRAKIREWNSITIDGQQADLSKLNFHYEVKGKAAWKPGRIQAGFRHIPAWPGNSLNSRQAR